MEWKEFSAKTTNEALTNADGITFAADGKAIVTAEQFELNL